MSLLEDVHELVADRIIAAGIGSEITVNAYQPDSFKSACVNIIAAPGPYVVYKGTYGVNGIVTINLIARVIIPKKQSGPSAHRRIDRILSTGEDEDLSLADAISGNEVAIGSKVGAIHAADAQDFIDGVLDPDGPSPTPIVQCDLPIMVVVQRS